MKKRVWIPLTLLVMFLLCTASDCDDRKKTANKEQAETEKNQQVLLAAQPPPKLSWSLERDNLIKRFKLQNDRTVNFYMYIFIEGVGQPIGYYMVNKVSSVDSQLTNTQQIVSDGYGHYEALPSPAEDGSYGTNGDGVFGFTPEQVYIEHNMKYVCSTVPLNFKEQPINLGTISVQDAQKVKEIMDKISK